jgi:hypothetical protein
MPSIAGIDAVIGTDGRSPVKVAADVRDVLRIHDVLAASLSE